MGQLGTITLWLMIFISLGRVHEIFSFLMPFKVGKLSLALGLGITVATNINDLFLLLTRSPIKNYLIAIAVIAFLGVPFSVYPSFALEKSVGFLSLLLAISTIVALGKGKMETIQLCLVSVLSIISLQMIISQTTGRVSVSMTYDPNDIALLCVTFLPFALYGINHGNFISKIFSLATSAGAVASIALSASRGGLVALACIALYSIALAKKRRLLLIILCALGVSVFTAMAGDRLWERMDALMSGTDYNLSSTGDSRLAIWSNAIDLMIRRPILGVGIGQFSTALGTLTDGPWKTAHNSFFQIGVELGVGGLIAFLGMIYFTFKTSLRGSRATFLSAAEQYRYTVLRMALLGFCTGGFFVSHAYSPIPYTLFSIAVIMHYELDKREKRAQLMSFQEEMENTDPLSPQGNDSSKNVSPTTLKPSPLPLQAARKAEHIHAENMRKTKQSRLLAGDRLQQEMQKKAPPAKEE